MPSYQFENAANPSGFTAFGTPEQADEYLGVLNCSKLTDVWSYKQIRGELRGISLNKLLAPPKPFTAEPRAPLNPVQRARAAINGEQDVR